MLLHILNDPLHDGFSAGLLSVLHVHYPVSAKHLCPLKALDHFLIGESQFLHIL